jgi:serine/threonine protein kinase
MLGFGAFGEIHLAYDTSLKVLRAIKFEIATHKNPQLKHEHSILEQLNKPDNNNPISSDGILGIPKVYLFDRMENKYNYMVMDFLGPSLSDLFQFKEKSFSLETTLMLGIQMLTRIEFIHEKGFIHRDIKPENFVIGRKPKERIIYMIDFGLSKRYINEKNKNHISLKNERGILGTLRYISINCHEGLEVSRRDDLESLFYIIIYFFTGNLPWIGIRCKNKEEKYKKVYEKKKKSVPNDICKDLPEEFKMFISYVLDLDFMDKPNYNYLNGLIDRLITKFGCSKDDINFDWYNEEFLKKLYDTCARNNNNTSENNNNINDNNINNNKNNNKEIKEISGKNSNIKKNNVSKKSNLNNVKININAFKTPPIKTKNKDNLIENIPIYKKNKFEGRKMNGRHNSNIPISKKKLFEYKSGKRNISNLHEQKTDYPKMKKKI